jgi:hypothetical protein
VTWDDRKVTSVNWASYHSFPLGFDVPKIESVLIDRPDEHANGAGETSITVIAALSATRSSTRPPFASARSLSLRTG